MTQRPFDFRKPAQLPATLGAALAEWARLAGVRAGRAWSARIPFAPQVEPRSVEVRWADAVADSLPENVIRYRATRSGSSDLSVLAVSRPLLAALVGGLLGEQLAGVDLDRPLTVIEDDVAEAIARQWFLDPLQLTWPLPDRLVLDAPVREAAQGGPAYLPKTALLTLHFQVLSPLGEWDWWWMIPRDGWVATLAEKEAAPAPPSREERVAVLMDLGLDLTVHLGTVGLPLSRLAALQPGDVLLLDQPIGRPLPACVAGRPKFLVWPGACGRRQAVAIHSHIEGKP